MTAVDKKWMLKKLDDIRRTIDHILPKDDNFWEEHEEDVRELAYQLNVLEELIINASNYN